MFENLSFIWPIIFPIAAIIIIVLGIIFYFYNRRISKLYEESADKNNYYLSLDILKTDTQSSASKYKELTRKYNLFIRFSTIFLILSVLSAIFLLARPAKIVNSSKGLQSRDIVLCADVSGSVLQYDKMLFQSYLSAMNSFATERISLVIFDSTARVVFPLTDDHKLITQKLSEAVNTLEPIHENTKSNDLTSSQIANINQFLSGTNQKDDKASLVGDGLATCLTQFDNNDTRNRSVVLTTDNDSSGKSIFTLTDSLQYASQLSADVYAIYSAGNNSIITENAQSMKKAVEQRNGYFYDSLNSNSIKDIVNLILSSQQAKYQDSNEAIITEYTNYILFLLVPLFALYIIMAARDETMTEFISPIIPIWAVALVFVPLLIFVIVKLVKVNYKVSDVGKLAWTRRLMIVLVLLIMVLSPQILQKQKKMAITNLDYLVVFDKTGSMSTQDQANNVSRLKYAQLDLINLSYNLPPGKFSAISFGPYPTLDLPLTSDTKVFRSWVHSITPEITQYSEGTALDSPVDLINQTANDILYKNPHDQIILLYLTDGEDNNNSNLANYEKINNLIYGGAVIGYGSQKGAMIPKYVPGSTQKQYIIDAQTNKEAISKINLKNISILAKELKISAIERTTVKDLSDLINDIYHKNYKTGQIETQYISRTSLVWPFSLILSFLILWEFAWFILFHFSNKGKNG